MSTFTALNLEPEDASEEEVDDTKEIQLEEAFKLYHNALRLHSQGPQHYIEALDAYQQLFESEIFRYPEAISEYTRDELEGAADDTGAGNDAVAVLPLIPTGTADTSPNSLPQIIHLAHKNRGQFALDFARSLASGDGTTIGSDPQKLITSSGKALIDFADALERDDTDLDLWRKAARVADVFSSHRISRFCLESVLAGEDDASNESVELSGLDEAFAAGELRALLGTMHDTLSLRQTSSSLPKKSLFELLKKRIDPYPFLPARPSRLVHVDDRRKPVGFQPTRQIVYPVTKSWLSVGQNLLQAVIGEQQNSTVLGPGAALTFASPEGEDSGASLDAPGQAAPSEAPNHHEELSRVDKDSLVEPDNYVLDVEIEASPAVELMEVNELTTLPEVVNQDSHEESVTQTIDVSTEENVQTSSDVIREINQEQRVDEDLVSVTLPTRKRSATSAAIEEPVEAGRTKSKRLRARESNVDTAFQEEDVASNLAQYYDDQLEDYANADQWMFEAVGALLSRLKIEDLGDLGTLRGLAAKMELEIAIEPSGIEVAAYDLRCALNSWNDEKGQAILYGHERCDFGGDKAGLTLFLEHSRPKTQLGFRKLPFQEDEGLDTFIQKTNSGWSNFHAVTFDWLQSLVRPLVKKFSQCDNEDDNPLVTPSTYTDRLWTDELKQLVVQLIVHDDENIFDAMQKRLTSLEDRLFPGHVGMILYDLHDKADADMAQSLFELHLDIYSLITNPSSQVDTGTRVQQQDRLRRWADLAGAFISHYANRSGQIRADDSLVLRFIWASATHVNKAEDAAKDHVMLCLHDMQSLLRRAGNVIIALPNNAVMPEVSISAVDQEISSLSTLDFFMSIFNTDTSDPITIIERLEPILEPQESKILGPSSDSDEASLAPGADRHPHSALPIQKLIEFLESGDASLRLFLWKRLREAYQSIDYQPKVVSCYLRSIESIMNEFSSRPYLYGQPNYRQIFLLKWFKEADDLVVKVLVVALNKANAFECIDDLHLRSSMAAIAQLSRILHSFTLYDDSVRVGQIAAPVMRNASSTKAFEKIRDKLREMQIRAWTLQYTLLKEGMGQNKELFAKPTDDLAEYLRSVHNAMGIRSYCKYSNKMFIKLMKSELLANQGVEKYSADVAQVLYDLHQLKFAPGIGDVNHACPPEPLDKKTAAQMVEVAMSQARRINIKDLAKSELKTTIEKIQQALGAPRTAPALSHNKRTIAAFLKSPINPNDLYRCIRGMGDLATKPVISDNVTIANHGWYFLLGHIALSRFKSTKRVTPTPTDDLDIAATFFRQDLEHGIEKWETWFRLAQVYDTKIEDDLLWTADKINNHRQELATLQRNAIHAYAMAVAVSIRNSDESPETSHKISEMYTDFATRLYASSREPLMMDAFKLDNHLRIFSGVLDQKMYKAPPFASMKTYSVWKFASHLLRRALNEKPRYWLNHYLLGKCLWKMFSSSERDQERRAPNVDDVIDAFTEAIETSPERNSRNEYILEPHFKLVSVVHKLVLRKIRTPTQGQEILQATRYARQVHLSEDDEGWEPYILEILKKIRHADKSNWHHRIFARAAHVIYDDQKSLPAALGAKHEFTQQIFTKTMTLQVWKPENERPGRHFVYTSRYVSFFVTLLNQLNDRTNLDLLVRRIRRKPTDYLDHQKIWEETTVTYLKVLRRIAKIPEGHEEATFKTLNHEDFSANAAKLETWAHDPETTSLVLDILRDVIELKKLNNSLMKGPAIDDLIADTYASLYEVFVSQLPPEQPRQPPQNPPQSLEQSSTVVTASPAPPPPPPPPIPSLDENRERMRLGNVLMSQVDGVNDANVFSVPTSSIPSGTGPHSSRLLVETPPPPTPGAVDPAPGPAIPATRPIIGTMTKPHRAKAITRREILRKAEGIVIRPPPIKTPILPKRPITIEVPPVSNIQRSSSISLSNTEVMATLSFATTGGSAAAALAGAGATGLGLSGTRIDSIMKDELAEAEGAASVQSSSQPASVHDSADDESELSEIDDDEDNEEVEEEDNKDEDREDEDSISVAAKDAEKGSRITDPKLPPPLQQQQKRKQAVMFPGLMGLTPSTSSVAKSGHIESQEDEIDPAGVAASEREEDEAEDGGDDDVMDVDGDDNGKQPLVEDEDDMEVPEDEEEEEEEAAKGGAEEDEEMS